MVISIWKNWLLELDVMRETSGFGLGIRIDKFFVYRMVTGWVFVWSFSACLYRADREPLEDIDAMLDDPQPARFDDAD